MKDRRDKLTLDLLDYLEWYVAQLKETAKKKFTLFETKAGPITEEEIERICEMAEQGIKAWSIARSLQRHPSTVAWQMWRLGLKPLGAQRQPFKRGDKIVVSFTDEEDAFIVEQRIDGHTPTAIARMMTERFPHKRSRDTVATRLMMLASHEAVQDDLA